MSKTIFRSALLATTVFTGMVAAPAAAQDTVQPGQNQQGTPAAPQPADEQSPAPGTAPQEAADQSVPAGGEQEEIVVTGTLIRNPNLEQSTPVNVTTSDTIELKQSNVAEEVLREIPGVVANRAAPSSIAEVARNICFSFLTQTPVNGRVAAHPCFATVFETQQTRHKPLLQRLAKLLRGSACS